MFDLHARLLVLACTLEFHKKCCAKRKYQGIPEKLPLQLEFNSHSTQRMYSRRGSRSGGDLSVLNQLFGQVIYNVQYCVKGQGEG